MTISKTVLAITSVFGGGGGTGGTPPNEKRTFKKWVDRLADALKRFAGKAVEALSAIVGIVVGAILSFLGIAVGFVVDNTWALIVFIAGLIDPCAFGEDVGAVPWYFYFCWIWVFWYFYLIRIWFLFIIMHHYTFYCRLLFIV